MLLRKLSIRWIKLLNPQWICHNVTGEQRQQCCGFRKVRGLGSRKSDAMARIKTALTAKSGEGEANAAQWRRLIDELNLRRRAAAEGGSSKARERHVARGKLLARERVAGLIDPGSPFLEIGALAAFGMYEGDVHGAGLVAGIGLVEGREVM